MYSSVTTLTEHPAETPAHSLLSLISCHEGKFTSSSLQSINRQQREKSDSRLKPPESRLHYFWAVDRLMKESKVNFLIPKVLESCACSLLSLHPAEMESRKRSQKCVERHQAFVLFNYEKFSKAKLAFIKYICCVFQ